MSDISSDRIKSLLSDPKNIELIASIAQGFGIGNTSKSEDVTENTIKKEQTRPIEADATENTLESESEKMPALAENFLSGSSGFGMPNTNKDKRIALLNAIKPYISSSKQEKVDGLVKAISVAGILNNYKGGLF